MGDVVKATIEIVDFRYMHTINKQTKKQREIYVSGKLMVFEENHLWMYIGGITVQNTYTWMTVVWEQVPCPLQKRECP